MFKNTARALLLIAGAVMASEAAAQTSPVGLWKSIDDHTGKPMALIRISDSGGELKGRIEKLFSQPEEDKNPKCIKCTDARKDQPVLGMTIIDAMRAEGESFGGGNILDPDNGKVYKSRMTLIEDGKKLRVRGYIGMPLFGRTQVWMREE